MSKYLAVEWDDREVRLVIANQRGAAAVLEQAFAVPLPAAADGRPQTAAIVAGTLRDALAGQSVKRFETLAAVGRPSIELKDLTLPPVPDDELPEMVRFQAMRDFTHLGDDWPLDFIPIPGEAGEPRGVLAAAIPPDTLAELRAVCQQAGVELNHLVLRPCSAAALLARRQPGGDQVRMLIDLLGDEVDLTALVGDTPIFMRTARLPLDTSLPESTRPLIAEVRRTIGAVHNRLKDRRVEAITLCGDGPQHNALAEQMGQELNLPAQLFDPFAGFELADDLRRALPDRRGRYAPLLGMVATAAAEAPHMLDFLAPRKRPVAKTRRRELTIAAAALGVLLVAFAAYTYWQLSQIDGQIATLDDRSKALEKQNTASAALKKDMVELDRWVAGDVPWLDVLAKVSTKAPKSEEAMLTNFKAVSNQKGGAELHLQGLVRTHEALAGLETGLRDSPNKVVVNGIDRDETKKRYPWSFKADVVIDTAKIESAKQGEAKLIAANAKTAKQPTGKNKTPSKEPEIKGTSKPDTTKPDTTKPDTTKPDSIPAKGDPVVLNPLMTDAAATVAQPSSKIDEKTGDKSKPAESKASEPILENKSATPQPASKSDGKPVTTEAAALEPAATAPAESAAKTSPNAGGN